MTEFTTEQAFEAILARLADAYRDHAKHGEHLETLRQQKLDADRALSEARRERQRALDDRDESQKAANAGRKLWAAVEQFRKEFSENPSAALMNLCREFDGLAPDLDPDHLPF